MTLLHVAIPITSLSTRLVIRKGQPWSIIEHLVLEAIAQAPRTRLALAEHFNLRLTIIDAALIRLVRALWIDMRSAADGLMWVTTALGRAALLEDELPSPGRIISRPITILIDRIAGHLLDPSELVHDHLSRVQQVEDFQPLCVLPPQLPETIHRIDELVSLLRDDEQLLHIDPADERRTEEVAVVRLRSGAIDGLPRERNLPELSEAIRASIDSGEQVRARRIHLMRAPPESNFTGLRGHRIRFEAEDLIVGGDAHRRTLDAIFAQANSRIILHSTFVGERVFRGLLPSMRSAVERGVHIDVLWGQDPAADADTVDPRSGATVIAALNSDPQIASLGDRLRIHGVSTRSHAKVIIADLGGRGEYVALIGSCNWLASGLTSIEVTLRIRTASLIAEVARCLSNLLYASGGSVPELSLTLLRIARLLDRRSPPSNANATADIIVGVQHQQCVLRARDRARHRIFVMSHRMSELITPAILVPFARAKARAQRRLTVTVLYGRLQDQVTGATEQRVAQRARSDGITLKRIRDPRIHAKVLAWNSDSIVVTSQNWLSADAMEATLATELGIAVDCPGIADRLVGDIRRIVEGKGGHNVRGEASAHRPQA